MNFLKVIWNFIWGLPQNICGLIGYLICKYILHYQTEKYNEAYVVYATNQKGSLCLGLFLFVSGTNIEVVKHEYGHCQQSAILGPIWFFVIGIPSFIWCNCFDNYRKEHQISYYDFYTEKWANKLGDSKLGQ